jgi:hypothetical protein
VCPVLFPNRLCPKIVNHLSLPAPRYPIAIPIEYGSIQVSSVSAYPLLDADGIQNNDVHAVCIVSTHDPRGIQSYRSNGWLQKMQQGNMP